MTSGAAGVSRLLAPALPAIVGLAILLVLGFPRLRPPWMQARLARWSQLPARVKVRQAIAASVGVGAGAVAISLIFTGVVDWIIVAASVSGTLVGWSIMWLRAGGVAPSAG